MRDTVRRVLTVVFACALLCPVASGEQRPLRITLKPRTELRAETFTVRDVANLSENVSSDLAETVLGNTPWPGHARNVAPALIRMRLASKGFAPHRLKFAGASHCRVTVDTVRIEPKKIVAEARRYVEKRLQGNAESLTVELLHPVDAIVVEAGEGEPGLRATMSGSGPPLGRIRVKVVAIRSGVRLGQASVNFEVHLAKPVAVATARVRAGEKLSPAKIDFQKRDVSNIQAQWISSVDMFRGKKAVRSISPGEIVTREMLEEAKSAVVIDFHERVHLVVESQGLRVITLGRSLCRARRGHTARAENLSSGREVVGVAVGESTVRVHMEGSRSD